MKTKCKILSIEELKELKGGDQTTNSNSVNGCVCYYDNAVMKTTNENAQPYCVCQCIKKAIK